MVAIEWHVVKCLKDFGFGAQFSGVYFARLGGKGFFGTFAIDRDEVNYSVATTPADSATGKCHAGFPEPSASTQESALGEAQITKA